MKDQYLKKFKPEKLEVIEWLATPKSERCTQQELAEEIGVASKTIWEWKKDEELMDAVISRKKELVRSEDLVEIVDALVEKAKKGNIKQAEFLFDWLGEVEGGKGGNTNIQVNVHSNIPRSQDEVTEISAEEVK